MQPVSMPSADHELLQLFHDPSTREQAFTLITKKYQERLYWHIRRMVIYHEDTNDVLQNVLLRVWKGLESFREESQLFTWLYRVATNECLNYLEKQKKSATHSFEELSSDLSERIRADEHFDPAKLEWKLQLAIQSLPEKQRIVFTLRYYDELPYEEMSQVLDTSAGALKASYHHAAKKIEEYLLNR
jgi:RNA polymerase sigma-70 factor (ECF subfamily)